MSSGELELGIPPPPPPDAPPLPQDPLPPPPPAPLYFLAPPPGSFTRSGLEKIRSSLDIYKFGVLLTLISSSITFLLILYAVVATGSVMGPGSPFAGLSQLGCGVQNASTNSTCSGVGATTPSPAISLGEDLLGVFAFILTVIAWLRWREGTQTVASYSWEGGPAHQETAHSALEDYSKTIWTFVLTIIVVVIGMGVLISMIFTALTTVPPPTPQSIESEVLDFLIVFIVAAVVMEFLQYYFASRSIEEALTSLADPDTKAELAKARRLVLVGAALSFVPIVGGLCMFLGMFRFQTAYTTWLDRPFQFPPSVAPPVLSPIF